MSKKKVRLSEIKSTQTLKDNVKIQYIRNNKVVKEVTLHNKGSYLLLEGIARYLGSQMAPGIYSLDPKDFTPQYLAIGDGSAGNYGLEPNLEHELNLTNRLRISKIDVVQVPNVGYTVKYVILIPSQSLLGVTWSDSSDKTIKELALCTTGAFNSGGLVASLLISDSSDYLQASEGLDLVVNWDITIGNSN